jgi:tetratricopeptide (TPR) repeat protein
LLGAAAVGVLLGRFAFLDAPAVNGAVTIDPNPTGEEQLAALEERAERTPDDPAVWQQLALVATTYGIESGDLSGFQRASAAVARAEALDPDAFETHLAHASLALTLHRFTEAAEHAQAAVDRNPYSADALAMLVDAQVELGHYDDAASSLQQMLDLDPGLPALTRTSYLRELHGDLPGALQAMQLAQTASAPSGYRTAVVATLAGGLHLRLGQLPAATAAYERAEAAAPGFEPALLGSVHLQAASGDLDGAIRRLADIDDPGVAAATLLGNLLRLQGREAEARSADQLVRASFADEEQVGHVTDLDLAAFEVDRTDLPQRAIDLARIAHRIRPDNVSANDTLGWALTRAGRAAEAIPFVDAALRLGSADPASRVHAAAAYLAIDEHTTAARHLRLALDQPWTTFVLQPEVERLAAALDVPLPAAWVRTGRR